MLIPVYHILGTGACYLMMKGAVLGDLPVIAAGITIAMIAALMIEKERD
jgi:hypothetical protein